MVLSSYLPARPEMINTTNTPNVARNDFDELMKIQRMVNNSVLREIQEDKTIALISLINEMASESKPTQIENIFIEAENIGYSESDVLDVIERMKRDSLIFEPQDGFIQKRA